MKDEINIIYENSKQLLLQTDGLDNSIKKLDNLRLKYICSLKLNIVQESIMNLLEFCYEVLQCEEESELLSLIEKLTSDKLG